MILHLAVDSCEYLAAAVSARILGAVGLMSKTRAPGMTYNPLPLELESTMAVSLGSSLLVRWLFSLRAHFVAVFFFACIGRVK